MAIMALTVLGRSFHLPASLHDWLGLIAVLAITIVALTRIAGWPMAVLGFLSGLFAYAIDKHLFLPATIAVVAALAALSSEPRRIPGRRVLREGMLLAAGFIIYEKGRALFVGDEVTALRNGEAVLDLERRFGLAFEQALQQRLLDEDTVLRLLNGFYSWAYLPFVLGAIFWLFLTDERGYRRMRNALGISVVFALTTIALFPVAPPRLVAGSGLVDTHALYDRAHAFVNPFAAVPSFHVGWTLLAGLALFMSVDGPLRWVLGVVPASLMSFIVIATGNHYWVDGVVGAAFVLIPFLLFERTGAIIDWTRRAHHALHVDPWARASLGSLVVLLAYLITRQVFDPGFTNYWGYMVAQIVASIAIAAALQTHFSAVGGLSAFTYVIVALSTWADTLGTAGHMYSRFDWYDKLIHFGGGVTITAVAADIMIGHQRVRGRPVDLPLTAAFAFAISSLLTVGWEIYEYLGDRLFSTGRHAGRLDTTYDLIADTAGTLLVVAVLVHRHRGVRRAPARRLVRHALITGIFLPFVVLPFVGVAAVLTPAYDPIRDTLSNLGAQQQPHAIVARTGFILLGVMIVFFAAGVGAVMPRHAGLVRTSLTIFGLSVAGAGIFRDHPATPGSRHNLEGFIHNSFGLAAIAALLVALVAVSHVAAHRQTWRPLLVPGLGTIAVVFGAACMFLAGPKAFSGVAELSIYTTALLWMAALGVIGLGADASAIQVLADPRTSRPVRRPAAPVAGFLGLSAGR